MFHGNIIIYLITLPCRNITVGEVVIRERERGVSWEYNYLFNYIAV